jgi:hypothetical protein
MVRRARQNATWQTSERRAATFLYTAAGSDLLQGEHSVFALSAVDTNVAIEPAAFPSGEHCCCCQRGVHQYRRCDIFLCNQGIRTTEGTSAFVMFELNGTTLAKWCEFAPKASLMILVPPVGSFAHSVFYFFSPGTLSVRRVVELRSSRPPGTCFAAPPIPAAHLSTAGTRIPDAECRSVSAAG